MSTKGSEDSNASQENKLQAVMVDCSSDQEKAVDIVGDISKTARVPDAQTSCDPGPSNSGFPHAILGSAMVSLGRNVTVPLASSASSSSRQIARRGMNMAAEIDLNNSQPSQYTPVIMNYHHHQHDNRHYQIQQVQSVEYDTAQLKARIKSLEESLQEERQWRTESDDQHKNTMKAWNTWRDQVKASYKSLQESKTDADQKVQKLNNKARQRNADHEEEIKAQKKRYSDLRTKYTTLQHESQDHKRAAETKQGALEADIATKDASIAKLNEEILELGKWKTWYSDLWTMKERLTKEKETAEKACKALEAQVASLEASLASRQSALDEVIIDNRAWEDKCKQLAADLAATQQSWLQIRKLGDE